MKMNKANKEALLKCLDSLENMEKNIGAVTKQDLKDLVRSIDESVKPEISEEQLTKKLDEGLPSETDKYNGMTFEDVLKLALSRENDALEINLMLIEMSKNEKDIEKFVEIANDENDHSLIYQGVLNRLDGRK